MMVTGATERENAPAVRFRARKNRGSRRTRGFVVERKSVLALAQLGGDVREDLSDADAEEAQGRHTNDRNQNDDQRVLNEALALFLGLEAGDPGLNGRNQ